MNIKNQKSDCCGVSVKLSEMSPDFIGDDPKVMTVGTCHYICSKCNKPCNIRERKGKK